MYIIWVPRESSPQNPFCTVLIITRARNELLINCIKSIAEARSPFPFEVLVVGNGQEIVRESLPFSTNCDLRIVTCKRQTPAGARNFALSQALGQWICFLDDDVELPHHYFETASRILDQSPNVDIFGGPDRTIVRALARERAIGLTLLSPLATATTRLRHGAGESASQTSNERQLILCNLWIRKSLFSEMGHRFDERFIRNEENILLHELRDSRMVYDPDLFVYHRRKTHLPDAGRAVFRSGFFRAKGFFLFPGSVTFEFFVPSMFLLYLVYLPFADEEWTRLPLFTYLALNSFFAIHIGASEKQKRLIPAIAFYQFFINMMYGAGFLWGLLAHRSRLFVPAKR